MTQQQSSSSRRQLNAADKDARQHLKAADVDARQDLEAADIDAMLSSFGLWRRFYPVGVYLFYSPIIAFYSWQMFVLTFAAWEPEFRCDGVGGDYNASGSGSRYDNVTGGGTGGMTKGATNDVSRGVNSSDGERRRIDNCSFAATPADSLIVEWNLVSC